MQCPVSGQRESPEQRLGALGSARSWGTECPRELERFIRTADDYDLFRVNPIHTAARRPVRGDAIELFLHAARVGCSRWTAVSSAPIARRSPAAFAKLDQSIHASVRVLHAISNMWRLDDYIQVTFSVSSGVRDIVFPPSEMLYVEDFYLRYNFSKGFIAPHGMTHQSSCRALRDSPI